MRRITLEVWLIILVAAANFYALVVPTNSLMNWFHSDDAFYYFNTARNIAEGKGITFDGLGRDSGFHPLWMIICVPVFALAQFDLILPLRLMTLIAILLSMGTAVLLFRTARRFLHPAAAFFLAAFFALFPSIHAQVVEMGMESGISAFFLALLLYRVIRMEDKTKFDGKEMAVTGLVAALTILARLDNVFVVCILGAWAVLRPNRLRYLFTADVALIMLGVLWSYFTRVGFGPHYGLLADSSYWMIVVGIAIRAGVYYLAGLYSRPVPGTRGLGMLLVKAALASLLASLVLSGVMVGLFALNLFPGFPRLTLAYEGAFALAAVLITRLVSWLTVRSASPEPEPSLAWIPTISRAVAFFAPIGLVLIAYMGMHSWYFDTAMPVSGQVKRWWGTLPNVIYGQPFRKTSELLGFFVKGSPWEAVRQLIHWPAAVPEAVRAIIYAVPVLALAWWQRNRLLNTAHKLLLFPLFAGCFIQIISYTGTGYLHVRGWYWIAQMMLTALLLSTLLDAAFCGIETTFGARTKARRGAAWMPRLPERITAVLVGLLLIVGTVRMVGNMPPTVSAENVEYYRVSIRELEENTEPGSRIGSTGGGVIAYFVRDRTIVNMDGLMNTVTYFEMLKAGTASQYLDDIGLDYVFAGEYPITSSDPYFQFKGKLHKLKNFGGATLFKWE